MSLSARAAGCRTPSLTRLLGDPEVLHQRLDEQPRGDRRTPGRVLAMVQVLQVLPDRVMRHAIGASGLLLVLASPLLALAWPRPFWLPASDHASAPEGPHDTAIAAFSQENAAHQATIATWDDIAAMAPPDRTAPGAEFEAAAELAATPGKRNFAYDWRMLVLAIGNLAWLAGMLFFASRHLRSLAVLNYLRRSLEAWPSRPAFRDEPEICRDLSLERLPPIIWSNGGEERHEWQFGNAGSIVIAGAVSGRHFAAGLSDGRAYVVKIPSDRIDPTGASD